MKKSMIVLAVAGAFAGSSAFAMDTTVNGFIDNIYVISDEAADTLGTDVDGDPANATEGKFSTDAEVDFTASMGAVSARIDLNVDGTSAAGGVSTEQAYGAVQINDAVGVMIGRMNNPMGFEGEDAPDLMQTSHSLVWDILDDQTSLDGNNVQGAAVKGTIGEVTVMGALLNEVGGVVDDTNSFMGLVSGSPLEGLDLELSFLTQEDNTPTNSGSFEGITNFNAAYSMDAGGMPVKVWLDYLTAGVVVDSAFSIGGNVGLTDNIGVTLRLDQVSFDKDNGDNSPKATTLALAWTPVENMTALVEWRNTDPDVSGADKTDALTLEGLFTF